MSLYLEFALAENVDYAVKNTCVCVCVYVYKIFSRISFPKRPAQHEEAEQHGVGMTSPDRLLP